MEDCKSTPAATAITTEGKPITECAEVCWCGRDFTLDELKVIVYSMRKEDYPEPKTAELDKLSEAKEKVRKDQVELESTTDKKMSYKIKKEIHTLDKSISLTTKKINKLTTLFSDGNCPLADSDKTYERFLEELNKTCTQYSINTCTRKVNFLAQIYWESARLTSTVEFSSGNQYNPSQRTDASSNGNSIEGDGPRYRGRGLMQLTWRGTYKKYFADLITRRADLFPSGTTVEKILDRTPVFKEPHSQSTPKTLIDVDNAGLVGRNLFVAIDSAGWFWSNGKIKNDGSVIDLNKLADEYDKKTDRISVLVNGGGNGKSERKKYYKILSEDIFNMKNFCKNYED